MSKSVKILTLIDVIFLMMLMLSGNFNGIMSDILHFMAFITPFAMGFYYSKRLKTEREEMAGIAEPTDRFFSFDKKRVFDLLPTVAPVIAVVFSLAALTSLLLTALGFDNTPVEDAGILEMIAVHALAPAIFEEMLFRYIPMKLLLPYSKRCCIFMSALYFSLIHANLFQMPYAFAAGLIFIVLDVALESVWPSLILHFTNNLCSVIWMKYCNGMSEAILFISVLLAASILSAVFIIKKRGAYKTYLKGAFEGSSSFFLTNAPVALIVLSLYIAIVNLFM